MDAKAAQSLRFSTLIHFEGHGRKPNDSIQLSRGFREPKKLQFFISANWQSAKPSQSRRRTAPLKVACSYNNYPASTLDSGGFQAPLDEDLILKNKSQEIEPYVNGRCIYLVGMMGSGKTTVGKILSQVLNYSFLDCDALVEEEVGGTSVADIFKHYGECFFRDKEHHSGCLALSQGSTGYAAQASTWRLSSSLVPALPTDICTYYTEVLQKLSLMHRLVISTGGGAVMRPINWKYMHKGISVWLDVPVEALAQRIAAVGTNSRPLLHYEAGDPYTRAFMRLSALFEERGQAYGNANARVSLENIATKLGHRDVSDLSPTAIAIEALEQIEGFLKDEDGYYAGC